MTTKKPYQAATLTYESAIEPISDDLCQRLIFEDRSATTSKFGDEKLAEDIQRFADVFGFKAEVLADFVARLFGLEFDEVVGDAFERAKVIYEERTKR